MLSSTQAAPPLTPTTCRSPGTPRGTMDRIRSKYGIAPDVTDKEIFIAVFSDDSAAFDMTCVIERAEATHAAYQAFLDSGIPQRYELPERIIRASRPGSHQPSLKRLGSI